MFTRYTYDEIRAAAPPAAVTNSMRRTENHSERALFLAICSLERIAGTDSPEGGSPETDAIRALTNIRKLIA